MLNDGNFPGGPVVENLPFNSGHSGLIPNQETKIPHAARQLSPCTATTESRDSGVRPHTWREVFASVKGPPS